MAGGHVALTVNAGSSSVRFSTWSVGWSEAPRLVRSQHVKRGELSPREALAKGLGDATPADVALVAHRVVHGGELARPSVIDAGVEAAIERACSFAPLHNPVSLSWIREIRAALGERVPEVAVFDTGFFASLPPAASTYAIPRDVAAKHGIRRYGFHGLAHESLFRAWRAKVGDERARRARVISLQLGSGCSACATVGGEARDTSMGFTPLEGLVMGTRSGDVDPGILLFLQREEGLDADGLERLLDERSGLLGVSGRTPDMRALLEGRDPASELAVAVWVHRVRRYVGAFLAVLGGADAVLVGGGVGENSPEIRERVLAGMGWCGLALDPAANHAARGTSSRIDDGRGSLEAWVLPVDEEALLVEHALAAIQKH